jgi:hypothetical protein
MRYIGGFAFFDTRPTNRPGQTPIFFNGSGDSYSTPELPINLFPTKEAAARGFQEYRNRLCTYVLHPTIASAEFIIPDSLEEERERLLEESDLIILHETDMGGLNLIGPATPKSPRYCNVASRLRDNGITAYHSTEGRSAYEIAADDRADIARQCQQAGITIAKFVLRKLPDSEKLITVQLQQH